MKILNIFLFTALVISFISCGGSDTQNEEGQEAQSFDWDGEGGGEKDLAVDSSEEDLVLDNGEEAKAATGSSSGEGSSAAGGSGENWESEEAPGAATGTSESTDQPVRETSSVATSTTDMGDGFGQYTVQSGDTMMLVSFKVYGDYTKWKSIANLNPQINSQALAAGDVIKYKLPTTKFDWQPSGTPYLIKRGDTLGTISKEKYGSSSKWKGLWDNNRPMIKNPNLIFAGFTLYYLPSTDVASE